MNTGQTVYEQLQNILNECIELGWKPFGDDNVKVDSLDEFGLFQIYGGSYYSYHDLFSKDSGFLQFLDRQYTDDYHTSRVDHAYDMVEMTAEEKCKYVVGNAKLPTKSE